MTPDARALLSAALSANGGDASSDFDLNPGRPPPPAAPLRGAAVLVAVRTDTIVPRLLLTKRSSALKHHPGQIAFPGGKIDPGDPTPEAAALREAHEEVGLPDGAAEVLGTLPPHRTVTGFAVTPVLALIAAPFQAVPEAGEVDEAFDVPLAHVLDPQNYLIGARQWRGQTRRYYTVPYGPYYIWGATARILRGLAARVTT
ncbi:CoA pyrophosphatase [Rhodobacteraceae bacterium CCMM004]|nr:CoA pyrophosphatase [Rhodobacteraceae bacterium CCMM004]